ncbi:hypothetical protein [Jiella pelagia]|uniref:Methyl-accepting chemotaxis protein n=1 Tax=Jiella pelagia TaxID=2986949 RepID=A0ABY7C7M0_9HYPH|nr:hypothetical protein [Jiella pelagia]WAP70783.1 hypothetical protein OH818_12705 [Jiella pelagia]
MRLTLKAKLGATFAVIVALSGISMFVAIENLGNLNDSIEGIVKGNAVRTEARRHDQRPHAAHRPR